MALKAQDITADKIEVVEMFLPKMVGKIETLVSCNQSKVFLVDGKHKEFVGFYLHIPKKWSGRANWPNQFNEAMEKALVAKGKDIAGSVTAPVSLNQLQKQEGTKA